jgi:uncharacterized membrane protein (Fun14 family)
MAAENSGPQHRPPPAYGSRPWHALSVRLAAGAAVISGGLWAYAAHQSADATTSDLHGWAASAPAVCRFAVSFLGGFLIAWLLRRFLKWTLLIAGIAAIAVFVLRKSGVIELPWDRIESDVKEGSAWVQSQAGATKKFLTGYLPSGFGAIVGGFLGFRR